MQNVSSKDMDSILSGINEINPLNKKYYVISEYETDPDNMFNVLIVSRTGDKCTLLYKYHNDDAESIVEILATFKDEKAATKFVELLNNMTKFDH